MEQKQLNFSAPLMSARRYPSPLRPSGEDERGGSPPKSPNLIPSPKPGINLSEVGKPGTIPFIWEKVPGKVEGGNKSQIKSPHDVRTTTKLQASLPFPPGKKSGELNGFKALNNSSGELVVLRPRIKVSEELNVPRPHKVSGELSNLGSKFSGEMNTLRPYSKLSGDLKSLSSKFYSSNDINWDSIKEGTEMNESESDDNNATFSDANETFSQHEPFSINCSFSGLSQLEPPEFEFPSNLPTDPKARDFMMNRFLPAAKAMTLEPSQYPSRKQLGAVEKPEEVKDLVPRAMTPPPNPSLCKIVLYTGQDIGSEESAEEEEDSYDEENTYSAKVKARRFLPWFCSLNSLRLVNPLPSLKDRSRSALSSASKLSKLVKNKSWRTSNQKLVKDPYNNPKQVRQVYKSCELQNPPKYTPRPMFHSGELQTRSGSPYRSSRRSNVSPFRNESPQPLYQKSGSFLAVLKQVGSLDENQSNIPVKSSKSFEESKRKARVSSTRTPVVEKTQYLVDSVNITEVSQSVLNIPKNKRQVDLSVEEAVRLEYGGRLEILKARGRSGPLICGGFISSEPSKTSDEGYANTCRDLVLVPADDTSTMQSSLTPPLPKSPSESWLSRQLPSVSPRLSPRNSVSYSNTNSKYLIRKQSAPASVTKWENIVKSSHLHQDHGLYTEELVTHVFAAN